MKLWAIQAYGNYYGNYGGGCAFVRAATKERALELAAKIQDRSWQTEIVELADEGEGVLYHFETGE